MVIGWYYFHPQKPPHFCISTNSIWYSLLKSHNHYPSILPRHSPITLNLSQYQTEMHWLLSPIPTSLTMTEALKRQHWHIVASSVMQHTRSRLLHYYSFKFKFDKLNSGNIVTFPLLSIPFFFNITLHFFPLRFPFLFYLSLIPIKTLVNYIENPIN